MRLIFICALRIYRPEPSESGADQSSILRQFRHLVELHYQEHWLVPRYAEALGVNRDRLHRICKRETGWSPAELVYERLTAEAKARLKMSGFPLKKIAADLGFADATRFSHFFKRRTEMSPGAYRAIVSVPNADNLVEMKRGFSDWPWEPQSKNRLIYCGHDILARFPVKFQRIELLFTSIDEKIRLKISRPRDDRYSRTGSQCVTST